MGVFEHHQNHFIFISQEIAYFIQMMWSCVYLKKMKMLFIGTIKHILRFLHPGTNEQLCKTAAAMKSAKGFWIILSF